ncbi:hypothetical protein I4U23_025434 [Adineta vaga]|nr:hypothetical protein I4U23_025434 [Adineta vaga]
MNDLTSSLDNDRKRPYVSSDTLESLKSLINENLALNNSLNDQSDEIESKKRKESQIFANRNVFIECLTKSDVIKTTPRRVITLKEYSERHHLELTNTKDTSENILIPPKRIILCESESIESVQQKAEDTNEIDPDGTPQFPSSSSSEIEPLSAMHIAQQWCTRIHQIIASSQTQDDEIKSNRKFDLTSFNFTDNSYQSNSVLNINKSSPIRQYPIFQSVPTPTEKCHSFIPSELLDCCQSNKRQQVVSIKNKSEYWDSFHTSVPLRETMINISQRLIKNQSIPIVDTHCHFDLIFDRLYIKHNDLTKYFHDYKDFYPPGLSFELAIHVFWRPRHLTPNNWMNRYSKYLNDERVYGSCGIHPHWSAAWKDSSVRDIERCLQHPKVVAIGEIGLDFGPKNTCDTEQQCRVFGEQLKLAAKWSKPIVIHSRNAYPQTFDIMREHLGPNHKIHLHCFVGTIADAELFTSYFTEIRFGFTPLVTRGTFLHAVIEQLDLRQILSETDSPYFVPEELSNLSRCAHPGMAYSVIETIAQVRQLPIEQVAYQLRENTRQIYGV